MTNPLMAIRNELEVTKKELEVRLTQNSLPYQTNHLNYETVADLYEREKTLIVKKHVKEELFDVERALTKMQYGIFGICEESGQEIPLDYLRILPTVRTFDEAETTINGHKMNPIFPIHEHVETYF